MSNPFQKASRSQVFVKLAITGPTGSGKTLSAILLASGLIEPRQRIAFEDTENDSASLYADMTEKQCRDMKIPADEIASVMAASRLFDVMPIPPPFLAESFSEGILAAVNAGIYGAVIIDSASHLWKGILSYKDSIDAHGKGNSYTNWKQADNKFEPVIEAVLHSKIHVIFCMRSKMDYVQTEENGKKVVKKLGLAPIMRDGLEYEFSTVLDIGLDHSAMASKDRTGLFPVDKVFQITEQTGRDIASWLKTATPKPEPAPVAPITDDEAKVKNVERIRKVVIGASEPGTSADVECLLCKRLASMCEDNRDRWKLEDFSLDELRSFMQDSKYKAPLKLVLADVKATA